MDILWLHFDGFVKPTNNEKKNNQMKNEKRVEKECALRDQVRVLRRCVFVCVSARSRHQTCNALKIETPAHKFEWCKILIGKNPS